MTGGNPGPTGEALAIAVGASSVDRTRGDRSAERTSALEVITATTIGNALEFFDFTAYNFFSVLLGRIFFPTFSPLLQLFFTTGTFAVGYVFRPLGGILIGAYADRVGRKAALMLTVGMMAFSSALIGCTPSYPLIGIWAPSLVLLSRILQGISAGGEVGASTALLIEYAGPRRRGHFGSYQFASQCLGVALGAIVTSLLSRYLSPEALENWGWRTVFLLGILVAPVGVYIRHRLRETLLNEHTSEDRLSLAAILRSHAKDLTLGVFLIFGVTSANFIILFSLPIIAIKSFGFSQANSVLAGVISGLVGFVLSPVGGWVSDRLGRKAVILVGRLLVVGFVVPLFIWLRASPTVSHLLIVEAVLSASASFGGATAIGWMTELFPSTARATGMAIIYSLGVALSGVIAQFVSTYFVGLGTDIMPTAWYVVATLIATTPVLIWLPETRASNVSPAPLLS